MMAVKPVIKPVFRRVIKRVIKGMTARINSATFRLSNRRSGRGGIGFPFKWFLSPPTIQNPAPAEMSVAPSACLRINQMRFVVSALLALSAVFAPLAALAQSADVEATITDVSTSELTIRLDDGETYQAPTEFNFEGLEAGVKVFMFYTVDKDGKRVINDLEIVN